MEGGGMGGGSFQFTLLSVVIILVLTICFYVPGVVAALVWKNYQKLTKRFTQIM
jgi:hypothetical protein